MRTRAAIGARRANDVIMIIAGLWRYGNWRHVATGCSDLVLLENVMKKMHFCHFSSSFISS